MKHYLVNTPLILQDEQENDYRVERGEVILLSDEEYAQVAAHVTFVEFQSQNETNEQPEKAKRGKAKDAE